MVARKRRLKPGEFVRLKKIPPGFLRGLPASDKNAIREIVGKPILLEGLDDDGRAEPSFSDRDGTRHFIYVKSGFIEVPTEK